jgi:hypothetical protein
MLTFLGFATLTLIVVAVFAALGKIDLDHEFSLLGYSFEFQCNKKVPLGIMVAKD